MWEELQFLGQPEGWLLLFRTPWWAVSLSECQPWAAAAPPTSSSLPGLAWGSCSLLQLCLGYRHTARWTLASGHPSGSQFGSR